MSHYIIELLIAMLLAFFIGCIIGCLLRKLFTIESETGTSREVSAPVERTPAVPSPSPRPAEPVREEVPAAAAAPLMGRPERPKGIAQARGGKADNLQRISGVGPKNERVLHNLGFFHFDQIADWTPEQIAWVDDHLKFNGRIDREEWVRQARLLADGNEDEFRRLYGTGGIREGRSGAEEAEDEAKAGQALPLVSEGQAAGSAREKTSARPKGIAKARGGKADNLQRISGVGPKNERVLHNLGFFHFDQIAAWTAEQMDWVDDHLKFNGRIRREEWVKQAKLLAEGQEEEFTRLYGTGGLKDRSGEKKSGERTRRS